VRYTVLYIPHSRKYLLRKHPLAQWQEEATTTVSQASAADTKGIARLTQIRICSTGPSHRKMECHGTSISIHWLSRSVYTVHIKVTALQRCGKRMGKLPRNEPGAWLIPLARKRLPELYIHTPSISYRDRSGSAGTRRHCSHSDDI
jgi:hypothetical protein